MEIVNEEWRPVVGRDGYEVSNLGRVRSLDREVVCAGGRYNKRCKGQMMTPVIASNGYVLSGLVSRFHRYAHALVAAAFIGPRPERYTINHIDGNKQNNCVDNLEYVPHFDNIQHAIRTGLRDHRGEKSWRAKATAEQVIEAVRLHRNGLSMAAADRAAGVPPQTVTSVLRGKSWKHLNLAG